MRTIFGRFTDPHLGHRVLSLAVVALVGAASTGTSADAQNRIYVSNSAGELIAYDSGFTTRDVLIDPAYLIDEKIAIAPQSNRLYWAVAASGRVHRAESDGTTVNTIITGGLARPDGVAVDEGSDALFIFDRDAQAIYRATASGANLTAIIPNVQSVDFMDVDAANDRLYWSQRDGKALTWQIHSAEYDGQDVQTILDGSPPISGMDIDEATGKIYWSDSQALRRADLDGSSPQTLYEPPMPNQVSMPAVDADDDRVYFILATGDQQFAIHYVPLAGGSPTLFTSFGPPVPLAIDAEDDALYWTEVGRIVQHDGQSTSTHVPSIATPLSVFTVDHLRRRVFSASPSGASEVWVTNLDTGIAQLIHTHARSIVAMEFDFANDRLLWLDDLSDVYRANANGSQVEALVTSGIGWGRDLFVDPVTNKFYVADSVPDEVVQYDLDGSNETVIIDVGGSLTSFAIDHATSTVYYANNSGLTHFVQKVPVGGTIPLVVVQEDGFFERLRLNGDDSRLHWLVSNPREMRSANLDGSSLATIDLTMGAATPMAFEISPDLRALGDVTGNGVVNIDDLIEIVNAWGPCPPPCGADLNGDGTVNIDDLLLVINHWS